MNIGVPCIFSVNCPHVEISTFAFSPRTTPIYPVYISLFHFISDYRYNQPFVFQCRGKACSDVVLIWGFDSVSALCLPFVSTLCALPLLFLCVRLVCICVSVYFYWVFTRDWKISSKEHWRLYKQKVLIAKHT